MNIFSWTFHDENLEINFKTKNMVIKCCTIVTTKKKKKYIRSYNSYNILLMIIFINQSTIFVVVKKNLSRNLIKK